MSGRYQAEVSSHGVSYLVSDFGQMIFAPNSDYGIGEDFAVNHDGAVSSRLAEVAGDGKEGDVEEHDEGVDDGGTGNLRSDREDEADVEESVCDAVNPEFPFRIEVHQMPFALLEFVPVEIDRIEWNIAVNDRLIGRDGERFSEVEVVVEYVGCFAS